MSLKISRRMVMHRSAKTRATYGFRSHYVYDWQSELFWGAVSGSPTATRAAALANARYMNHPGQLRNAKRMRDINPA